MQGKKMTEFREYFEEKENQNFDKEILEEGALSVIGTILGYTVAGGLLAFGGTLAIMGGKAAILKLRDLWRKILNKSGTKKEIVPLDIMHSIETNGQVKAEKVKVEEKHRTYEDNLKEVYEAIEKRDFEAAKQAYYRLGRNMQASPDVYKAIIVEITKTLKEPPLYIKSPGNATYQAIKKVLNIRVARAAAEAVEMALMNGVSEETEHGNDIYSGGQDRE
jgi:hypothetical protein